MKAHVIENNLITNTIEVESLDLIPNLVEATEGSIGWSYVDGVFTEPADTRTDAELAEAVRTDRDTRLVVTDLHGLTDNTMSAAMTAYRQALRDVPQQDEFPSEIDWPTEPT